MLQTGTSPTIEAAIAASGQAADVERRRGLRDHFLSRAQVVAALRNTKLTGPRVEDYRGDLQMHSTWSDGSQTLEDIIETGIKPAATSSARSPIIRTASRSPAASRCRSWRSNTGRSIG